MVAVVREVVLDGGLVRLRHVGRRACGQLQHQAERRAGRENV